jgi:rhodanese-related sulfurtransferase
MEILKGEELQKMIASGEDLMLIDVRTEEEVAEGKIANTDNLDIRDPEFVDHIAEYDRDKTYVMICRSGGRSAQACMHMMDLGFKKIYNLEGGMLAWTGEQV